MTIAAPNHTSHLHLHLLQVRGPDHHLHLHRVRLAGAEQPAARPAPGQRGAGARPGGHTRGGLPEVNPDTY